VIQYFRRVHTVPITESGYWQETCGGKSFVGI